MLTTVFSETNTRARIVSQIIYAQLSRGFLLLSVCPI